MNEKNLPKNLDRNKDEGLEDGVPSSCNNDSGTCRVEFLALHHSLLPNAATKPVFGRFRSRDRIGEKGWGKTCPKDYESLNLSKKKCTYSKCKYQLLHTVTLLFPQLGGHKISPWKGHQKWVHLRGLLGNLSDLATYSHSRARNSAWRSCAPGKLQLLEEISKSESLENATWITNCFSAPFVFCVFFPANALRFVVFRSFFTEVVLTNPIFFVFLFFIVS